MNPALVQNLSLDILLVQCRNPARGLLGAKFTAWVRQGCLHPGHLPFSEYEHRVIVDIVHVVHEHVPMRVITARYAWKGWFAIVLVELIRRIIDEIGVPTGGNTTLTPDVR